MSGVQRIIKYCAMAFAFYIIISIILAIGFVISNVSNIFDNSDVTEKLEDLVVDKNASIIDINLNHSNLIIKEGENLKALTNNKYIKVEQTDNKLVIKEKKRNWFLNNESSDLVIYIPSDLLLSNVSISSGAGKINITSLSTKELELDLGAGSVTINSLNVIDSASIDSGVGEFQILDGSISNLDLDLGVGKTTLNVKLLGDNDIEAGVGAVYLNLLGSLNDYKVIAEKGLGSIRIDEENIKENTYYGTGNSLIDIDGGIGSININFK